MAEENSTSIKALIQGMMPTNAELMQGTVISASPLKIQMVNDEKLIITERITVVPRHLSDYTTTADFTAGKGLNSSTAIGGSHEHSGGEHGGHISGNGSHNHDGGAHSHKLSSFTASGTLTVHNALKVGETVYVLSLNNGKLYYVLDRTVV